MNPLNQTYNATCEFYHVFPSGIVDNMQDRFNVYANSIDNIHEHVNEYFRLYNPPKGISAVIINIIIHKNSDASFHSKSSHTITIDTGENTAPDRLNFDWSYIESFILNNSVEHAYNSIANENHIDRKGHFIIALDLAEKLKNDGAELPDECKMVIPLLETEEHFTFMDDEIKIVDGLTLSLELLSKIEDPSADTKRLIDIINGAIILYTKYMYDERND